MKFWKYSSTGNDFILIDNRLPKNLNWPEMARSCCHRRFGIGADGLILLESSQKADFRMVIYNADGSEAEMCGNGTRAIAHFARFVLKIPYTQKYQFQTQNSVYQAWIEDNLVTVQMSEVGELSRLTHSDFHHYPVAGFVDTGVPHCVLEVSEIEELDVQKWGNYFRYHEIFSSGANVNFIKPLKEGVLEVRTYERGVEAETYSCGTGVLACALVAHQSYQWKYPISLETRGGELQIEYREEDYFLKGPTHLIFSGELKVETEN